MCRFSKLRLFPFFFCKDGTVRSGAEERMFWGARLDVLIFRLHSYHILIMYSAECDGPKFCKTLMFLGQAGMFLSFQAKRSSATRSSTSDLTVVIVWWNGPLTLVVIFFALCLLLLTWSIAGVACRACHSSGTFFSLWHTHTHTHTHTW